MSTDDGRIIAGRVVAEQPSKRTSRGLVIFPSGVRVFPAGEIHEEYRIHVDGIGLMSRGTALALSAALGGAVIELDKPTRNAGDASGDGEEKPKRRASKPAPRKATK